MDVIPYEENSFYIFDRGYNDFKLLYNIESIGAYFVVRGKKNNDFKPVKWARRFPPESGILSDATGYMEGLLTREKYPDKIRRIKYWDEENKRTFIFFTNALDISPIMVAERYHQRWQIELFFYDKYIVMQSSPAYATIISLIFNHFHHRLDINTSHNVIIVRAQARN